MNDDAIKAWNQATCKIIERERAEAEAALREELTARFRLVVDRELREGTFTVDDPYDPGHVGLVDGEVSTKDIAEAIVEELTTIRQEKMRDAQL